jgi:hypothetical protein
MATRSASEAQARAVALRDVRGCRDLVVVPLAFRGDRRRFYESPPAPRVAIHDWIWRRPTGPSRRISFLLLKRLNLTANVS